MSQKKTYCKYGDCDLEKLESELIILDQIWSELEENWAVPNDYEDVYRIYPLLDTTAALSRKRLNHFGADRKKYQVMIVKPSTRLKVDTSKYFYSNEPTFFNGKRETCLLADVVSTILHGSNYVYMDTRKIFNDKEDFEIYVYIETDKRAQYIDVRSYIDAISKLVTDEIKAKPK